MLSSFYRYLVYCHFIVMFGLLSVCYDAVLLIVLLQCSICVKTIQIGKIDLIS